ncbi:MAG: hypothetical protein KGM96_02780 [Acidobacteriota bacterium]|nr:hypothetical protein [Acidobacteriota bacterium]
MGYYTSYSLTQLRNAMPSFALASLIATDESASSALTPDGDTKRPEKWYEHEQSICAWSTMYPDTVFRLHADGEDADGIWDKYFLGGKLVHTEFFKGLPLINAEDLPEVKGKPNADD